MSNVIYEILDVLYSGQTVSADTIREKLGITNVAARILELRNAGYSIYTNRDGYRLGRASERFTRNLNAGRTNLARKSLYATV